MNYEEAGRYKDLPFIRLNLHDGFIMVIPTHFMISSQKRQIN